MAGIYQDLKCARKKMWFNVGEYSIAKRRLHCNGIECWNINTKATNAFHSKSNTDADAENCVPFSSWPHIKSIYPYPHVGGDDDYSIANDADGMSWLIYAAFNRIPCSSLKQ